ncbi:MAG: prepilin-type N-terminal cleavage/methylation domain-containing protein, partial [Candidatus Pacebacteria bacterium]|nr:prepilin-type N-terminal cleavage/methylation domain-containing protein [Candidatus Paceibacterota bacterium]
MLKNKSNNNSFILLKKNSHSSFTLIELLVVITIIVIIGAIIFASTADARKQARDTQRIQNTKNLAQALELYYSDYWQYPAGEIGSSSDDGFCIELTLQDDGKTCKPNSFCSLITQKDQDGKVKYLTSLPKDPLFNKNQCSISPFSDNCHCILYKTQGDQEYKLFSKLEDENNDLAKNDG